MARCSQAAKTVRYHGPFVRYWLHGTTANPKYPVGDQVRSRGHRMQPAYALRAIGQQARGVKPDFMGMIYRPGQIPENPTNVLRHLAPELLGDGRYR